MKNLDKMRLEINRTDDRMLQLFAGRMRTAAKIAIIKKASGMQVYVPEREQAVLDRLLAQPEAKALHEETSDLFTLIMQLSVKIQTECEFRNIVLTGMPGCGKTVIGKRVASLLGLKFIDIDNVIEEQEGMPVFEIFEKHGEAYFRDVEKRVIAECAGTAYSVISTGGGAVLSAQNVETLKTGGDIYFIDRPPEQIVTDIDTSARPLLKGGTQLIFELHAKRYEIYKSTCTFRIDNSGKLSKAVAAVADTAAQAMLDRRKPGLDRAPL